MSTPAGFFGGAVSLQRAAAEEARIAENSARQATHTHRQPSLGVGRQRIAAPVVFALPFLEEPTVLQGFALVSGPTGTSAASWHDPNGGATVRSWVRNDRGFYTGALISIWVDCRAVSEQVSGSPSGVSSVHYVTFSGPAYKAMDAATALASRTAAVREVSFT